jgi:hypothetical protein
MASAYARVTANDDAIEWLTFEMSEYNQTEVGEKYARFTGRWDDKSDKWYTGSASAIFHQISAISGTMEIEKAFTPGDNTILQMSKVRKVNDWAIAITLFNQIISNIKAQVHIFPSQPAARAYSSFPARLRRSRAQSECGSALAPRS